MLIFCTIIKSYVYNFFVILSWKTHIWAFVTSICHAHPCDYLISGMHLCILCTWFSEGRRFQFVYRFV